MNNEDNTLDIETLYEKYEPLRKATSKKFLYMMRNMADKEDLFSVVNSIFAQLVEEYDPRRGVDFPFYIKRMLDLRVYHYITKYLKTLNTELPYEDFDAFDKPYEDNLDWVIDILSIDPNIVLGDKHRKLMENIFIHKKTLKEMAQEEGIPVDRIHARLYFLVQKGFKEHRKAVEKYGENLY